MSGQDAEEDGQLLSSKRVGGYIYQLVGYPKTQTSAATQSPAAPQASATSAMPATVSEDDRDQPKQTARKTLGPRFKVPPHLMGRTAADPESDAAVGGRKPQKPRPGVAVPALNLTSQMLSKDELCREVVQRSGRPNLAHRLQDELARKMAHQQSTGATHADLQSNRTEPTARVVEVDVAVEDGDATAVKNQPVLGLTKEVYAADLKLDAFMEDDGLPDDASESTAAESSVAEAAAADATPAPCAAGADALMDVEAAVAALHGEALEDESVDVAPVAVDVSQPVATDEVPNQRAEAKGADGAARSKRRRKAGAKSASPAAAAAATAASKTKTPAASKAKLARTTRTELDRLFIDEGAINMLYDMEKRGLAGRRSAPAAASGSGGAAAGAATPVATLIPKELLNQKTLQTIRSTRMQQRRQTLAGADGQRRKTSGVRKLAKKGTPETPAASDEPTPVVELTRVAVDSHVAPSPSADVGSPDENPVFHQWQSIKFQVTDCAPSVAAGEEMVFLPRHYVNPADASQIIRRRSCSTDSSGDERERQSKKRRHADASAALDQPSPSQDSFQYEEISVRHQAHLVHVVLSPRSSILPHSLNANMLTELTSLLRRLKDDAKCLVVLLTSAGSSFCSGIDYPALFSDDPDVRLASAQRVASLISDFVTEVALCDKLLVGGLAGSVAGLGVALLPYLDVVYASDKATFQLPYARLGQSTEGGLALTLGLHPAGHALMSSLVYEGRHLTATEMERRGLVDAVLWPSSFHEDLMSRVQQLATQATQNLVATKRLVRAPLRRQLAAVLDEERRLLVQCWTSNEFQRRARHLVDSGRLLA